MTTTIFHPQVTQGAPKIPTVAEIQKEGTRINTEDVVVKDPGRPKETETEKVKAKDLPANL